MRTRKELRLTMMPGQAIDLVRTLVLGVLGDLPPSEWSIA